MSLIVTKQLKKIIKYGNFNNCINIFKKINRIADQYITITTLRNSFYLNILFASMSLIVTKQLRKIIKYGKFNNCINIFKKINHIADQYITLTTLRNSYYLNILFAFCCNCGVSQ